MRLRDRQEINTTFFSAVTALSCVLLPIGRVFRKRIALFIFLQTLSWNVSGQLAAGLWIPFDDIDEKNGAMSVLPRWHLKGVLKRKVDDDQLLFNEEIDPNVLPDDLEKIKVQYNLRAGQLAIHNTMIPHNSVPNRSSRWRRVLVLRYIDAAGDVGDKQYNDYRTGEPFTRECYLVRGQNVMNHDLKRSPF